MIRITEVPPQSKVLEYGIFISSGSCGMGIAKEDNYLEPICSHVVTRESLMF